jgi:predicted DNA-binding WGR domain protein
MASDNAPAPEAARPSPKPKTVRPVSRAPGEESVSESSLPPLKKTGPIRVLTRYFEYSGGNAHKFWEVSLAGASFTVRFGRIGNQGQTQSKLFPDGPAAKREIDRLIAEKLKKGYREKTVN